VRHVVRAERSADLAGKDQPVVFPRLTDRHPIAHFWAHAWRRSPPRSDYGSGERVQHLRCDVLVHVEEVGGVIGALDLNQPIIVLPVVVLDLVIIVVLHEVDITALL
jgi:hypothetical protein